MIDFNVYQPCRSTMNATGDDTRSKGVVKRGLMKAYRKVRKVKLKRTPSDADSVAPDSSSESEASVM